MNFSSTSLTLARKLDAQDPLRHFRKYFAMADPLTIYLDGNSLGRLPNQTILRMQEVIQNEWGQKLIGSWNQHWIARPSRIAAKIARLVGAKDHEILITDSTSLNLFKLAVAALRLKNERSKIISDALNFPSDLYILQGIIELFNQQHELVILPSKNDLSVEEDELKSAIDGLTALVVLSHVTFKSAFMYDMKKVTQLTHEQGSLIVWDLSHAVGAVPIDLNGCTADFAIGCTYKYLNGGPGTPAFLYIREDLQERLVSPVWGWFGSQKPFDFNLHYTADTGINRFAVGTPPILAISALEPALDIHLQAGIENIRHKSIKQSEYLINLAEEWLMPLGFELGSPRNPQQRGSHIALKHQHGYQVCQAMIRSEPPAARVIPDFRRPDNIRMGIAPLYTSFEDIYLALDRIRTIVETKIYLNYSAAPSGVT